jgi:prolipoprotein diacylglyceryltransferase
MGAAYFLAKGTTYQKHIPGAVMYAIIGALIGARIWHVFFFQWGYYSKNLGEIFSIWNGGIAIQGALIGGDSPRYAFDWTAGQWTSISVIIVSLGIMVYFFICNKKKENSGVTPDKVVH